MRVGEDGIKDTERLSQVSVAAGILKSWQQNGDKELFKVLLFDIGE